MLTRKEIMRRKFVENELRDLDVPVNSKAWIETYKNAIAAFDYISKKEVKKYIEDILEMMPNWYFTN